MLKFKEFPEKGVISVVIESSGAFLGELYREVCGEYVLWLGGGLQGSIPSWVLRQLLDKLDDLNKGSHNEF